MKRIQVFIVDDSALMRRLVSNVVARDAELEIVGMAGDGYAALEKIPQLRPDIVTLDIEMPGMDGRETLRAIRERHPAIKVIMCSSLTVRGAEETLDALAHGAVDYVAKPAEAGSLQEAMERFASELLPKIKVHGRKRRIQPVIKAPAKSSVVKGTPKVLCIGSSTGGPNALATLFESFVVPFDLPVLIVQHMPPVFTAMMAQRLNRLHCGLNFQEAAEGQVLQAGQAYIAPGGRHLQVCSRFGQPVIHLNDGPAENSCRPSVDILFASVAEVFGGNTLAVILIGMGSDGCRGCERLWALGARVLAQDENTSVVWGMPGSVVRAGVADEILPLSEIGGRIQQITRHQRVQSALASTL